MSNKIDFPKKGVYKRVKNRIYFLGDFEDGEEIEFAYSCGKPSSTAIGNAWYKSCNDKYYRCNLINVKEISSKER